MLLSFRASNVRSFRDQLEFSLEASTVSEVEVPRRVPWRNGGTTTIGVLPAACVFGANASGKTNLLRAMNDMRDIVRLSYRGAASRKGPERTLRRLRRPFRLDPDYEIAPSRYEIEVIIDGILHGYGFEIDDSRVISEWAWRTPKGRKANIFYREGMEFTLGETVEKNPKSRAVRELLRPESLLLSLAAAAEYEELAPIYNWFERNFILCDASSRESRLVYTAHLMSHEEFRDPIVQLLQCADLGITEAKPRKAAPEELEMLSKIAKLLKDDDDDSDIPEVDVDTFVGLSLSHQGRDGSCEFDSKDESLGTLVWLGLLGPVLDSLSSGSVLLADELESSLHPKLVEQLVILFQDAESNPNGAQLIFNSHEARLLGNSDEDRVIGRDQAWFAEKMNDGASRLYPLTDMSPRKSEAIARRYMQGRYGAVPIISGAQFSAIATMIADKTHIDS